jgi:hypothetical protein
MTQKPAPLAEPIEVAKWWKSRRRDTVRKALERARELNLRSEGGGE